MRIRLNDVRKAALLAMGRECNTDPWQHDIKLPADFETRSFVHDKLCFKVLTTAEAREISRCKQTKRPHRILVWDGVCGKWQFAGKYAQHVRYSAKHVDK